MVRIFWYVMLLLATTAIIYGAQAPTGVLTERSDGSYIYIVSDDDRLGQWQVAFGEPVLWLELVSANPQLRNPHKINPGDTLNIPTSMILLFRIMLGSHNLATATTDTIVDTVFVPATTSSKPEMSDWFLLFIILTIALIMYMIGAGRTKMDIKSKRKIEDPYSGPNRVEGGLPTAEAAINYFTHVYENERLSMSVGEAEHHPPVVHIVRMVPVDVKGPMWILYGFSDDPVKKNIPDWVPAWQCWLDDGSYRLSLMVCGNDVRSGSGMTPLSEDQIRPRRDMQAVELNHQVWPMVSEEKEQSNKLERLTLSPDAQTYREARIKSRARIVLLPHDEGQEKTVDISDFGDLARLSIIDGQVVVEVGGKMLVLAQIGEKDPLEKEIHAENTSLIDVNDRPSTPRSVD